MIFGDLTGGKTPFEIFAEMDFGAERQTDGGWGYWSFLVDKYGEAEIGPDVDE